MKSDQAQQTSPQESQEKPPIKSPENTEKVK